MSRTARENGYTDYDLDQARDEYPAQREALRELVTTRLNINSKDTKAVDAALDLLGARIPETLDGEYDQGLHPGVLERLCDKLGGSQASWKFTPQGIYAACTLTYESYLLAEELLDHVEVETDEQGYLSALTELANAHTPPGVITALSRQRGRRLNPEDMHQLAAWPWKENLDQLPMWIAGIPSHQGSVKAFLQAYSSLDEVNVSYELMWAFDHRTRVAGQVPSMDLIVAAARIENEQQNRSMTDGVDQMLVVEIVDHMDFGMTVEGLHKAVKELETFNVPAWYIHEADYRDRYLAPHELPHDKELLASEKTLNSLYLDLDAVTWVSDADREAATAGITDTYSKDVAVKRLIHSRRLALETQIADLKARQSELEQLNEAQKTLDEVAMNVGSARSCWKNHHELLTRLHHEGAEWPLPGEATDGRKALEWPKYPKPGNGREIHTRVGPRDAQGLVLE